MAEILALHFGGYKKTMASILGMGAAPPPPVCLSDQLLWNHLSTDHMVKD